MAGIAITTAEVYARHNIPSIPLGANKRPAVKGFKIASLTMDQSRAYMRRRPDADALGIPDGRLSGLVRLDIDEHGDDVVAEVIRRAGDTPFKVRTASGKMHLVYADNGERRLTGAPGKANARPWPDFKVDLCGQGGYSISPPSRCNGGTYDILGDVSLEQMLASRKRLPKILGLDARSYVPPQQQPAAADEIEVEESTGSPLSLSRVPVGGRDDAFYPVIARMCKRVHLSGGTKDDVMAQASTRNGEFHIPLEESVVSAKVNHWWDETLAGRNWFGTGQGPGARRKWMQALAGDPPLLALICWLKDQNRPNSEGFMVADGLVGLLGGWWSEKKLREYRRRLIEGEWIVRIQEPMRGRAALYRWGPTAIQKLFS